MQWVRKKLTTRMQPEACRPWQWEYQIEESQVQFYIKTYRIRKSFFFSCPIQSRMYAIFSNDQQAELTLEIGTCCFPGCNVLRYHSLPQEKVLIYQKKPHIKIHTTNDVVVVLIHTKFHIFEWASTRKNHIFA